MSDSQPPTYVVYDGECPFCTNYVRFVKLREAVGPVELVDARGDHPILAEVNEQRLDLDEGMAVKLNGRWLHGAECVHVLALLSSDKDWINRLNAAAFRSEAFTRFAYPFLRFGRNTVLRLLGRKRLRNLATG